MRLDRMVLLPPEAQQRLNATLQAVAVDGLGNPAYEASEDGFGDYCESVFGGAEVDDGYFTPDELEEKADGGYTVTGTALINILLMSADCEAVQENCYLVGLPDGPRWFMEIDLAEETHQPLPALPLSKPFREPDGSERYSIAAGWRAPIWLNDPVGLNLRPVLTADEAMAFAAGALYALNCDFDIRKISKLIVRPDGTLPATPLALLNAALSVLHPGVLVACVEGVLQWVLFEPHWETSQNNRAWELDGDVVEWDFFISNLVEVDEDEIAPTGR